MNERRGIRQFSLLLLGTAFFFSPASWAQTSSDETKGTDTGNYNVQQSVEIGYRKAWIYGNPDTYDTFVNLNTGARLLDYTVDMRSINHQGILFDNLNFSNFGYGGDPDDVSRLRIEKNKTYDFSVVFRRHVNFWDYNLLANPLNPAPPTSSATTPSLAFTNSPHSLDLVRRMQDYDLTLAPQSRVRVRLGFSHYADQGPSLTTVDATEELLLAQYFRMTTNTYHVGVDFRVLPKTTISFDQFLEYDKQDTSDSLANTPFLVQSPLFPGTLPVNMGTNWYYPPTATTVPCAAPLLATGYANTTCKMVESESRAAPTRNSMPTERLSFQSTYIPKLEMSAAASYTWAHNFAANLYDSTNEWTASATSQVRDSLVTGPADAKELIVHANWSGIYTLTQKVRILDAFRYDQSQNPGYNNQGTTSLFATLPQATGQTAILLPYAQFSPLVAGAPSFASVCAATAYTTSLTCPQHSTSAAADNADSLTVEFLGQRLLSNTLQIEGDLTKRLTGRIGWAYEDRHIGQSFFSQTISDTYYPGGAGGTAATDFFAARGNCPFATGSTTVFNPAAGGTCTPNSDGSITWAATAATISAALTGPRNIDSIIEQVGLAGIAWRPMDTLRINADFQFGYSNESFTRIWPRHIQSYKVHVNYKPRMWATIDGAVDIHQNGDNIAQVNNIEHTRTFSIYAMLAPKPKFAYSIGYNYTDLYTQTFVCFDDNFGAMTGLALPVFSPTSCAANGITNSTSNNLQGAMAFYSNQQNYFYSDVMWKPMTRVTLSLGDSATFTNGSTLILNPLQPAGTLAFVYQKPFASLQVDLYKGLSYKTMWDYYGYNSRNPTNISIPVTVGTTSSTYALQPIASPEFNGSTLMFALRYAF